MKFSKSSYVWEFHDFQLDSQHDDPDHQPNLISCFFSHPLHKMSAQSAHIRFFLWLLDPGLDVFAQEPKLLVCLGGPLSNMFIARHVFRDDDTQALGWGNLFKDMSI